MPFFNWIYRFFENHPRKRVFRNESLSDLGNVLQRNLRTDTARECIFKVFGGTNFENFSAQRQPWWHLHGSNMCTCLPKKNSGRVTVKYLLTLQIDKVSWSLNLAITYWFESFTDGMFNRKISIKNSRLKIWKCKKTNLALNKGKKLLTTFLL